MNCIFCTKQIDITKPYIRLNLQQMIERKIKESVRIGDHKKEDSVIHQECLTDGQLDMIGAFGFPQEKVYLTEQDFEDYWEKD